MTRLLEGVSGVAKIREEVVLMEENLLPQHRLVLASMSYDNMAPPLPLLTRMKMANQFSIIQAQLQPYLQLKRTIGAKTDLEFEKQMMSMQQLMASHLQKTSAMMMMMMNEQNEKVASNKETARIRGQNLTMHAYYHIFE